MDEGILLPFDLPTIARKRVSAAFDGGRITSDGGVMLLAQAERRLRIVDRLAGVRIIPLSLSTKVLRPDARGRRLDAPGWHKSPTNPRVWTQWTQWT